MSGEEKKKKYDIDFENLAIPEIHTGEVSHADEASHLAAKRKKENITYDTLAVPEIHIHKKEKD